jgi:hypothetical protein
MNRLIKPILAAAIIAFLSACSNFAMGRPHAYDLTLFIPTYGPEYLTLTPVVTWYQDGEAVKEDFTGTTLPATFKYQVIFVGEDNPKVVAVLNLRNAQGANLTEHNREVRFGDLSTPEGRYRELTGQKVNFVKVALVELSESR